MVFFHIESGTGVGRVKLKVSGSSEVSWKSTEEVRCRYCGRPAWSQELVPIPGEPEVSCRHREKLNKGLLFL